MPVLTGDQRAAYAQTKYFRISIIGTIMIFGGFGAGLIVDYMQATTVVLWCFGVAILGMIFLVGAKLFKKRLMETDEYSVTHLT